MAEVKWQVLDIQPMFEFGTVVGAKIYIAFLAWLLDDNLLGLVHDLTAAVVECGAVRQYDNELRFDQVQILDGFVGQVCVDFGHRGLSSMFHSSS